MDCDARRQILIRDLDGSLTGAVGGSVLAKAEFEWGGDKRYGLGMSQIYHLLFEGRKLIMHVEIKYIWLSSPVHGGFVLY